MPLDAPIPNPGRRSAWSPRSSSRPSSRGALGRRRADCRPSCGPRTSASATSTTGAPPRAPPASPPPSPRSPPPPSTVPAQPVPPIPTPVPRRPGSEPGPEPAAGDDPDPCTHTDARTCTHAGAHTGARTDAGAEPDAPAHTPTGRAERVPRTDPARDARAGASRAGTSRHTSSDSAVDARGASWTQVDDWPVSVNGSRPPLLGRRSHHRHLGVRHDLGDVPPHRWVQLHHAELDHRERTGPQLRRRINVREGATNWTVRGRAHLVTHDDCLQDDYLTPVSSTTRCSTAATWASRPARRRATPRPTATTTPSP